MIADDRVLLHLMADAQIHVDAAHQLLLEDGTDTMAEAYRAAFLTVCSGLYDLIGRNA